MTGGSENALGCYDCHSFCLVNKKRTKRDIMFAEHGGMLWLVNKETRQCLSEKIGSSSLKIVTWTSSFFETAAMYVLPLLIRFVSPKTRRHSLKSMKMGIESTVFQRRTTNYMPAETRCSRNSIYLHISVSASAPLLF